MNLNKVILAGNLTRDPEVRHLPTANTSICSFGIAVNEKWKDKDGNAKESVTFIDCDAWGKTGEAIAKFLGKGRPIFIEGRLKLDTWKDKTDGSNRSKLKVVVDSFQFMDSKPEGARAAPTRATSTHASSSGSSNDPADDQDIPF